MESYSNFEFKPADFMNCGSRKLKLIIEGDPVSQARPRFGRGGHAYEPKECTQAKKAIQEIAEAEMYAQGFQMAHKDMPVALTCWFYRPIPKSGTLWLRSAMRHNLVAPTPKHRDVDNCLKLVSDALNGIAFYDDAQVVDVHGIAKYAEEPRTEVLVEAFYTNSGDIKEKALELHREDKKVLDGTGTV